MNETTPLQEFLDQNTLSVSALARRVDLAIPYVWRMVHGKAPVSDTLRWRFLLAFGYEAAERVFVANGNGRA